MGASTGLQLALGQGSHWERDVYRYPARIRLHERANLPLALIRPCLGISIVTQAGLKSPVAVHE